MAGLVDYINDYLNQYSGYNPNDFSYKYNTELTPEEYKEYLHDIATQKYPINPRDIYEYDIQGAWKDLKDGKIQFDNRWHLTDKYKKPNHITFSKNSKYSDIDGYIGGDWEDLGNGKFTFKESADNRKFDSTRARQNYFTIHEPTSELITDNTDGLGLSPLLRNSDYYNKQLEANRLARIQHPNLNYSDPEVQAFYDDMVNKGLARLADKYLNFYNFNRENPISWGNAAKAVDALSDGFLVGGLAKQGYNLAKLGRRALPELEKFVRNEGLTQMITPEIVRQAEKLDK